jgi:phosphotransacetylase
MKSDSNTSPPFRKLACIATSAARVSSRWNPIGPRIAAYSHHSFHCAAVIDARK